MPFIIHKISRDSDAPYSGPACKYAEVPEGHYYTDRDAAVRDAAKLSDCNPVGFTVKEVAHDGRGYPTDRQIVAMVTGDAAVRHAIVLKRPRPAANATEKMRAQIAARGDVFEIITVQNLGWLTRNWRRVERLDLLPLNKAATPPPHWDLVLVARLDRRELYATTYASVAVCVGHFLDNAGRNRSSFVRGMECRIHKLTDPAKPVTYTIGSPEWQRLVEATCDHHKNPLL